MKKKILSRMSGWLGMLLLILATCFGSLNFSSLAFAEEEEPWTGRTCGNVPTSVLECNQNDPKEAIFSVLGMVLNILTLGIGTAATVGFIWCGYLYMTSKNEPAVIVKVKMRILHIVIGLVLYAMFWGVVNFLLPGGIFAGK